MGARQDAVDLTRRKITEAVMALHESVGPRHTTVSAVAETAGVTRLTVYRHFPDEASLVGACAQHWATLHPRPDVTTWQGIADPVDRLTTALRETYAWARTAAPMMSRIHRDVDVMPAFVGELLAEDERTRVAALTDPFSADGATLRRLTTAVRHALDVRTWQSLCERGQLADDEAAEIMSAAVTAALGTH
jgi:AcrR family transcriptional regulator